MILWSHNDVRTSEPTHALPSALVVVNGKTTTSAFYMVV